MSREYVNIKLVNPNKSELNGVPVHEMPEIKRYEGSFQLNDHVLIPVIGKTRVRFSDISLDCSLDREGFFAALEGNKPFYMHEEETGRQLAVLRLLETPTRVSFLDEVMATKPVTAAYIFAANLGELANHFFK